MDCTARTSRFGSWFAVAIPFVALTSCGGEPLIGFSLRAYDPESGLWPVYLNWHTGTPTGFSLMEGRRNGERMELFPPGDDGHTWVSLVTSSLRRQPED